MNISSKIPAGMTISVSVDCRTEYRSSEYRLRKSGISTYIKAWFLSYQTSEFRVTNFGSCQMRVSIIKSEYRVNTFT